VRVLLHHTEPGTRPVGVWWLPKHRSVPTSYYADPSYQTIGARAVLGVDYDPDNPTTLAQWDQRCESLAGSASPFYAFSTDDTTGNPQDLLRKPPEAA
jgi:hypothetical protein